ncbi:VWA domain-containing protein [Streptomyces sp. NPDC091377]|uniref:VWA domain-containing protein n=1 Tax=Streptomyces sp. NPDC091377 TaxID=3365995 RepID=UPI0037F78D3C
MVDTGTPGAGEVPGQVTVGLEVSQWPFLSGEADDPQMHAILTVGVDGTEGTGRGPLLAQVLAVDCSGSMAWPPEKLHAARQAAVAAIRMLPDGTPFAVVRGNEDAAVVYPGTLGMARADEETRAAAVRAVHRLVAGGGTCIGAWLELSRRLLAEQDAPIGHVLLLTDGKNQHDERMPLAEVLELCAGRLICDAWGIGDGWDGQELLGIARRLHGSASSVRDEAALAAEYEKLMGRLLAKTVPELEISVTPMTGAAVRYLKQVYPGEAELTPEGGDSTGPRRFVTRAWGDEFRRYQLCLSADPTGRPHHEDLQLAVVAVGVPGGTDVRLPPPRPCVVHWTDDPALSARTDAQVDHFDLEFRLAEAIVDAREAFHGGDAGLTERSLGRAVRLAHAMDSDRQLARLTALVEIEDAEMGRVRLRPGVRAVDFEHLITESSHSTYGPASDLSTGRGRGAGAGGATVTCPGCSRQAPATARFCPTCRHDFRGPS